MKADRIIGLLMHLALFSGAFAQGSSNVQFLANFNQYSNVGYNDCWGYTAPDGREYALLGVVSGTSVIDITNPSALREAGFIPNPTANSLWKDIKTYRHYAYVVNESGGGLQIIDLSTLPDTATLATTYTGFSTSHNIYIDTARALLYVEGDGGQPVRLLSLANPTSPVQVSSFGPTHSIHDIYARGNRAYVSEGDSGYYSIYDVTNAALPVLLKRFFSLSRGYAHNAWLSDDERYLMTTEEIPGRTVKLWDISDLDSIRVVGEYLGTSGLAHNTHIKGNYAYISHYKDGLKIVDISNPKSLNEAGYYNTYIGGITSAFAGAWGAFPFFNSGKVLISDMQTGLTVVYFEGSVVTKVENEISPSPFALSQNYPNPFNPRTTFEFSIPSSEFVSLRVYDMLGREVALLVDEQRPSGSHTVSWDASHLSSGVYYYRLTVGSIVETKKLILIR